jgi:hypothetical protein
MKDAHNLARRLRYQTDPLYRARVLGAAQAKRPATQAEREARLDRIVQSYLEYVRSVPA